MEAQKAVQRIGILGGTFDPIHKGHLAIAREAMHCCGLQQVVFVPAGDPPHKQQQGMTDGTHRLRMVELAIHENPNFSVCDYEINKSGPSYTKDLLDHFQHKCSKTKLFLILGADSLIELDRWHRYQEILQQVSLIVVHRPDVSPDTLRAQIFHYRKQFQAQIIWLEHPVYSHSSTETRRCIQERRNVQHFLTQSVIDYIDQQQLYIKK